MTSGRIAFLFTAFAASLFAEPATVSMSGDTVLNQNIETISICRLLSTTISSGQVKNDKTLSQIPLQMRERFVEKLKLYLDLKRTHQYEKLYERFLKDIAA